MDFDISSDRRAALDELASTELDVLIVGGGVVGSGIARDAALRGLKTAIVEQYDFASGTSSRSSRLLHGGIRYLAQGRIALVHEASVEKSVVHKIAPHISAPLAFLFPTYTGRLWDQWALWKLMIGVKIYDLLCMGRNLGASSWLSRKGLVNLLPRINQKKLNGGVRYFDGYVNDSRLVIDTVRSAAKAGAKVLNYCRASDFSQDGSSWKCWLVDQISGESVSTASRCVINATGAWAQQFDASIIQLRPSKGIHFVVDRDRLPSPDAVVMTEGSRILFLIPWGECMIVGTTDTDYEGRPEDVCVEQEDIDYVLGVVNSTFTGVDLKKEDIIGAWAGLRPLIADPKGNPSDISRSHEILSNGRGWWDVAGGKLTTYRLMAQQAVDKVQKYLGKGVTECVTAKQPLLDKSETDGISSAIPPPPSKELVEHYVRSEWAGHLDDVMIRRTSWAYYKLDEKDIREKTLNWMKELLSWDDTRVREELKRYEKAIKF